MYLTEIAESIVSAINASPPENWEGGLVLPVDLPVMVDDLDPLTSADTTDAGVFVIPSYNEYNLSNVRRVGQPQVVVPTIRYVTVAICVPFGLKFEKNQRFSQTPKSEWSLLSNLREDLEKFLYNTTFSGYKVVTVESNAPDEQAFDSRLYLVTILVGLKC